MDTIMYLRRLEDFTPQIALKALRKYMSKSDLRHIKIFTNELNLICNGICDNNMIKYVVSIGDRLYQIVAVEEANKNLISVVAKYSQI